MLQPLDHPCIPDLTLAALPLSFDGERALHQRPRPPSARHTTEILLAAGYDRDEITALAVEGVIRK